MIIKIKRCKECGEVLRISNDERCKSCQTHEKIHGCYKRILAF